MKSRISIGLRHASDQSSTLPIAFSMNTPAIWRLQGPHPPSSSILFPGTLYLKSFGGFPAIQDPGLKPASLMGQLTVFSISPHQLHLELLFQCLHCFADGRLGHMKILGRHGNVLISCRPRKISQLVKLHTLPLSFSKTRGRNPVPPLVCITFC